MSDRGGGEGFLSKASNKLRVVSYQVRQNDLNRELGLEVRVARFVNEPHAALAEAALEMVFPLEHGFPGDGMNGGHSIAGAGCYIISVAIFTKLAFLHYTS